MKKFLSSNETKYRLLRTILQGVIGVLIANVDLIIGAWNFAPEIKAFIVALVMAILSPIMSELGVSVTDEDDDEEDEDLQDTFNEDDITDMYEVEEDDEEDNTAEE